MADNIELNTEKFEKIDFRKINTGDKGTDVADNLLWNFEQLQLKIESLEEQIQTLSKNAYDGKTIWSDSGYTATIKCCPSMLSIQENKTQESTFDFEVTVMDGAVKLSPGTEDVYAKTYVPELLSSDITNEKSEKIGTVEMKVSDEKLSFTGIINPGMSGSGTIGFKITYKGTPYTENFYILVSALADDVESYYMSTVFKYSKDTPATPEGGSFNSPVPPTGGWSDGIPTEEAGDGERLYMSKRMFCSNSEKSKDSWSEPSIAFDNSDFDVCFSAWSGDTTPLTPDVLKLPHGKQDGDTSPYKWHDTGNKDDIWMATCVQSKGTWGTWSIIKIKGENGSNGQNGDWKDTIYKNFTTYSSHTKQAPSLTKPTEFVGKPDSEIKEERNQGWKDAPDNSDGDWYRSTALINGNTGEIYKEWSTPVLVSKAGKEGDSTFVSTVFKRQEKQPDLPLDGSYSNPIPVGWSDGIPPMDSNSNPLWTTHRRFSTNSALQDSSWSAVQLAMDTDAFDVCYSAWGGVTAPVAPKTHGSQDGDTSIYKWHDTGNENDIWMATSYKNTLSGWSGWCVTKIKGENGSQGDYMSFIFKQKEGTSCDAPNIKTPSNFVDKTNDEIKDDDGNPNTDERNQGWHDGPGTGDNWWMSCALIGGSTGKISVGEWSEPNNLGGKDGSNGNYIETQYSINSSETKHPDDVDGIWYDTVQKCYDAYGHKYILPGYYMWMRQRTKTWSEEDEEYKVGVWGYIRVTGEKGESGTGIKIKGTVSKYEDLFSKTDVSDGDGYVINDDLWLWYESTDYIKFDDLTPEQQTAYVAEYGTKVDQGKWRYVSRFAGSANYIHIKYADELDCSYTVSGTVVYYPSKAGNTPSKFIGVLCDTNEEAPDGDKSVWSGYTWSQFKGDDGYGYEYIYRTRANSTPYNLENASDIVIDEDKAKSDDYVPENWTDNPSGVNSGTPYEFMFMRKKENGKWGNFKGTAQDNNVAILYNYYGRDAEYQQYQWGVFKSLVYTSEMENDSKWHSSIKEAGDYDIAKGEYLWERERKVIPAHGDTSADISAWSYYRISGEKGDKGDAGTGIQLKGAKEDYESLFGLADKCTDTTNPTAEASHEAQSPLPGNGDCYSVNGHLWVWTESAKDDKYSASTVTEFYNTYKTYNYKMKWSDCGQIKGEPGETPYVHIKYASQAVYGGTSYKVTDLNWLTGSNHDGKLIGKFKAMWVDYSETVDMTNLNFVKTLDFVQDNGEDGIDFEYIYTRTSENTAPAVPTVTSDMIDITKSVMVYNLSDTINDSGEPITVKDALYQSSDVIPNKTSYYKSGDENINITNNNWTDNPMGPTDTLRYEWCCKREKKNGAWGGFIGRADNTGLAFLYSRYGQDGEDALSLNVTNQSHCYRVSATDGKTDVENIVMTIEPVVRGVIQDITDIRADSEATDLGFSTVPDTSKRRICIINPDSLKTNGSFNIDVTVKDLGTYTVSYNWSIVYDGEKGDDGTSISIKGQCVAHYANYAAMPSKHSWPIYSLILVDDASDFPKTGSSRCSDDSVLKAVPSVAEFVSAPDWTWRVDVAELGDSYVDTDGNLWVAGAKAWTNAGHIKGDQGVGVKSVNVYYALSSGYTESPKDSEYTYDTLDNVIIADNQDKYVWSASKVTLTDNSTSISGQYCVGKCSELASVTEQYGTSDSDSTEPTEDNWKDSYPEVTEGKYIWTRNKITWKKGDPSYTGAKLIGYIAIDGTNSLNIQTIGVPLVFDTTEDGLVDDASYKEAQLKVYQNGKNITPSIIRSTCTTVNLLPEGYGFKITGWGKDVLSIVILGAGIATTEMDDGTDISTTSGSLTVGFKYNDIYYTAYFPFSVNLNKYTHKISVTNKELESSYEELSKSASTQSNSIKDLQGKYNDIPSAVTNNDNFEKYTSDIKQTAREISLSVTSGLTGRDNILQNTSATKYGEGWTCMSGKLQYTGTTEFPNYYATPYEQIEVLNGICGYNCLHVHYIQYTSVDRILSGFRWFGNAPQGNIKLEKGETYTVSFWAKSPVYKNTSVTIELIWEGSVTDTSRPDHTKDETGYNGPYIDTLSLDSSEWQLFKKTFTVPEDSTYEYVEVNIFLHTTQSTLQEGYIALPCLIKNDEYKGWSHCQQDFDYVGGNLLDNTSTMLTGGNLVNVCNLEHTLYQGENAIAHADMTSSDDAFKEMLVWSDTSITNMTDYTLSFLAKGDGKVVTYLYNPNHNTTPPDCMSIYVENSDGYTNENVPDGGNYMRLTSEWKRYWVHWHVHNHTYNPTDVIIRCQKGYSVYVTQPKLEAGATMTSWTERKTDLVDKQSLKTAGINIDASSVTLYGNQVHIKSSADSQDDTVLIDTSTGKLKADLIDAKTVVAEGIDAKSIVAEGISGQTINADNATISNLTVDNATVTGKLSGVTGSFYRLECVSADQKREAGSISFGNDDDTITFEGDLFSQGYNYEKKRGYRFYASTIWCRGAFGHEGKTIGVVKGSYMVVYPNGYSSTASTVTVSLESFTYDGKTHYKVPVYGKTEGWSGMPIDVILFNTSGYYYYTFTEFSTGKEWRVINGNNNQEIYFYDVGGRHTLPGGTSLYCIYVNPNLLNPVPSTDNPGAGIFWSGEKDLDWA